MLAAQPMWQAGEPVPVTVHFDVPAHGPRAEAEEVRKLSFLESRVAAKKQGSWASAWKATRRERVCGQPSTYRQCKGSLPQSLLGGAMFGIPNALSRGGAGCTVPWGRGARVAV